MKTAAIALLAAALMTAACDRTVPLPINYAHTIGASLPPAPTGVRRGRVLARGTLTYAVAFAAASDRIAAVELSDEFALVVRDIDGHELSRVRLGEAEYDVVALDLSPDGEQALVASADGTVRNIEVATGAVLARWPLGRPATAVRRIDDRWIATGDDSGVVCLRRANDGALLQCLVAHTDRVSALDVARLPNPHGPANWWLASSSWDGTTAVWLVPTMRELYRYRGPGPVTDLALSRGADLAIAYAGEPPRRSPDVAKREQQCGFESPAPDVLIEVRRNRTLRFGEAAVCRGHGGPVSSVAWSYDTQRVISGSWDRTVRFWDGFTCEPLARFDGFPATISQIAVSPTYIAVAGWVRSLEDPSLQLLDLVYPADLTRAATPLK